MRYTTSLVLLLSTSTILLFHQCSAAPVSSNSRELLADVSRSFSFRNTGDSLIDFSFAGYRAGAEAVPSDTGGIQYDIWPTLDERDRTTDIQNALDAVGNLGGGIVRLAAGNYTLSTDDPLVISHSNVALRGDDSKFPSETVLVVTGGAKRNIIQLGSVQERNLAVPDAGQSVIAQEYVPLGATSVRVESAADFSEGQSVVLRRQVTEEWIAAMQMDDLVRNGKHQASICLRSDATPLELTQRGRLGSALIATSTRSATLSRSPTTPSSFPFPSQIPSTRPSLRFPRLSLRSSQPHVYTSPVSSPSRFSSRTLPLATSSKEM